MTSFARITAAVALGSALLFAPAVRAGEKASKATHAAMAMDCKRAEAHCSCTTTHSHPREGSAEPSRAESGRQTRAQPVTTSETPEFTDRG